MLLRAAAPNAVDFRALVTTIARLPRMDFYVPFNDHRLTWRGGSNVIVGATLDVGDPVLTAYELTGGQQSLDARKGLPSRVLFIIHPSEAKAQRPATAGRAANDPIQSASEARVVEVDQDRTSVLLTAAGGPPPAPPIDTTYIGEWIVFFGDWWGDNEVEFRTSFYSWGEYCCDFRRKFGGVPSGERQPGGVLVSGRVPQPLQQEHVHVSLWETDPDGDPDDPYGSVDVIQQGTYIFNWDVLSKIDGEADFYFSRPENRAVVTSVRVTPSSMTLAMGDTVFLTAAAFDQHNNPMPWTTFTWASSNIDAVGVSAFDYRTGRVNARGYGTSTVSASTGGQTGSATISVPVYVPSFGVTISEPANVRARATCTWFANAVGGSPPYTYAWRVNGSPAGGPSQDLTWMAGTTPFTIEATVTDATGSITGGSRTVNIDPYAATCNL